VITMQLTPTDVKDAKKVVDAAVVRGDLKAPEAAALYHSIFVALGQVGTVFDVVPMVEAPVVRRRITRPRRKKAIKP
jgi:hypothetical protein